MEQSVHYAVLHPHQAAQPGFDGAVGNENHAIAGSGDDALDAVAPSRLARCSGA